MGLIRAASEAFRGSMADQWKEFFYCDALEKDILVKRGQKRTSSRSSNTKGNDNVISNGSGIAVADGQCMLIVEQGKVVEVCAEPGEFTYDSSTEPSIFTGNLGDSIKETFKLIGRRFTYGGDTAKDQRVYYINTKELGEILFGTATPIPFRVIVSEEMGYKLSVDIRCNGLFTYRICDPILFYTNVCGNVTDTYDSDEIAARLKSEMMNALQPALAKLSAQRIQYYEIPAHTMEISDALNEVLSSSWRQKRGIEVYSVNINSLSIPDEQRKKLTEWEENAMTTNPNTAAARLVGGQIDAMKAAAANSGGAMTGFMGMGRAMNGAGGTSAQNLFAMGQQGQYQQFGGGQPMQGQAFGAGQNGQQFGGGQPAQGQFASGQQPAAGQSAQAGASDTWTCTCGATVSGKFCPECGTKKPEPKMQPAGSWTCAKCGTVATGKFCPECGSPKPADADGWTCSCGTLNKGKFCSNCGAKKPAGALLYKCDKCGWEPEDPAHPPKFCPECGDVFDDGDIVR